jgi:hypothetical protein
MSINPKIVIAFVIILALSLMANYHFYSDNSDINTELEQSKGRVQILTEQFGKSTIRIDSLISVIENDTAAISDTRESIVYITKYVDRQAGNTRSLPPDSAVMFLSKRVNGR